MELKLLLDFIVLCLHVFVERHNDDFINVIFLKLALFLTSLWKFSNNFMVATLYNVYSVHLGCSVHRGGGGGGDIMNISGDVQYIGGIS